VILTPKEKAIELVERSMPLAHDWEADNKVVAIKIALLCVDEMLEELGEFSNDDGYQLSRVDYLKEVKQELNKL
jgi:hypothetical protein